MDSADLEDMSLNPLYDGNSAHWQKWKDPWGQVFYIGEPRRDQVLPDMYHTVCLAA
jgi:hypothetical protein